MESVVYDDSPLAAYLEGEGERHSDWVASNDDSEHTLPELQTSFAPRGPSTLQARIRRKLPQPLRITVPQQGPVAKIHHACFRAVNSRIGRADNFRFLEQFRYLIVASQLLNEQIGLNSVKPLTGSNTDNENTESPSQYHNATIGLGGAVATGMCAFVLVWLIHWARGNRQHGFCKNRLAIVLAWLSISATLLYAYARRQWLQYLRQQAIHNISLMITNLKALDASTTSGITLVQEVELVSRGYRISSPLPPVSRIEEKSQSRRCVRLRKSLKNTYASAIPILDESSVALRSLVMENSLEKYMDVYDINHQDLQEASLGFTDSEFEDQESLKALRVYHYRLSTLRRLFLCSLLALDADGGKPDFARWRTAVDIMSGVTEVAGNCAKQINHILREEEQFSLPSPYHKAPLTPGRERLRNQVRKLSSLSQGIRGLQAKMQILREESTKSIEESEDVTEFGSSLMAQYDSIGSDLKNLIQAWESGRASLALNIDRHERRVSQASSGLRSPVSSLGGLTVVEEGSPSDALRALNGENKPPSNPSSISGAEASEEEVFEAIAIPRKRATLSREERMAKIQQENVRQATIREQREASTNMLRELESVINLRPKVPGRTPNARVTSI
ncbi:hypothetical protein M501DRAFT_987554 [Patellaria atrata CBS 101060]|uniref:Vezatin n=1 Tax=Patellaria atrata CBS 101060 TaxID=1346257 RepID=A0A9P4S559_9PEZI|nr:hypothetical protein M501DRAFT_987554 [Patellaria atrata CBS 101060]